MQILFLIKKIQSTPQIVGGRYLWVTRGLCDLQRQHRRPGSCCPQWRDRVGENHQPVTKSIPKVLDGRKKNKSVQRNETPPPRTDAQTGRLKCIFKIDVHTKILSHQKLTLLNFSTECIKIHRHTHKFMYKHLHTSTHIKYFISPRFTSL